MSETKRDAIREFYARHRRALLAFIVGKVGRDAASDLLQDTFVRALRYERIDEVADLRAFLRATAANLSRDYVRRRATEGRHIAQDDGDDDPPSAEAGPDALLETSQKSARLLAAVSALPPKCRAVFVMRRFEDLSQQEIAERLGISRNMVEKHLRLALERCRAAIEDE
jgi:RNA polymerase sigma-70 factor (ECF subfamily)